MKRRRLVPQEVFYFDVIMINTAVASSQMLVDWDELKRHCNGCKVYNYREGSSGRNFGYRSNITLWQATDKAIEILQRFDWNMHSVSYLEVAKDVACDTHAGAVRLQSKNDLSLRYSKGSFECKGTRYIGKQKGVNRGMYLCDYVLPTRKVLQSDDVFHREFRLRGKRTIKTKLGVDNIYDIKPAEILYEKLWDENVVDRPLRHSRIKKHFGHNVGTIAELSEILEEAKYDVWYKSYHAEIKWIMAGSKRIQRRNLRRNLRKHYDPTPRERIIQRYGLAYWLI